MSAGAETAVNMALDTAKRVRAAVEKARWHERVATVTFMDEALASGWTWERVGMELGVSGTAARRYYMRNRRKVRGGGA